ncbi:MAG: hypothetical protein M5U01_11800 [Ardenticatenaceae bacterium]|nr:hypothetical protein [Ardenticatenaceae bacterium]HBY99300.1 hypothetical protein [Chloroflexota bacterium]
MDFVLSPAGAISAVLAASLLWGSWAIALKHLDGYPVDAFFLDLYTSAVVLVAGVSVAVHGASLPAEIAAKLAARPEIVLTPLVGGLLYVVGMRIWLYLIERVGLVLASPIYSSVAIIVGTLLSARLGGLPLGASLLTILIGCFILIGAVVACVWAGHLRDIGRGTLASGRLRAWQVIALSLVGALLGVSYPVALSVGLAGPRRPEGLPVLPYMLVLAAGAWAGAMVNAALMLPRGGGWHRWRRAEPRYRVMGVGAAVAHYGGNIINAVAVPILSTAIAWPMGQIYTLWGYLWGIAYGEFRGATRFAYGALFTGVGLFILGVLVLGYAFGGR